MLLLLLQLAMHDIAQHFDIVVQYVNQITSNQLRYYASKTVSRRLAWETWKPPRANLIAAPTVQKRMGHPLEFHELCVHVSYGPLERTPVRICAARGRGWQWQPEAWVMMHP